MKYKSSKYNIFVGRNKEHNAIIYNSYSSALISINNDLEQLISSDGFSVNQGDLDNLSHINTLLELGIVVDNDYEEDIAMEFLSMREKYRTDKQLQITIAPTMKCNMICPYCFQSENYDSEEMEYDICDKIVDFIDKMVINHPYLSVTWFGGEPLIALNPIEYISKRLIDICAKKNILYNSSIITNGYLLDSETAKNLFEKCAISSAQITLDGLEEQHDKKRILREGGKSFSTIINNIKSASDLLKIVVRVNVDKSNQGKLEGLIEKLLIDENLKGKISIGISPVFDFQERKNCEYNEFCSKNLWNIESIVAMRRFCEIDHIDRFCYATLQPSLVSCSANIFDSFIFDPQGEVYKCFMSLGKKKYSIGNIKDISNFERLIYNHKHKEWVDASPAIECKKCVYLPLCQSGCLFDRMQKGISRLCFKNKENLISILFETYSIFEKSQVEE